jgi:oxygen-independent coproporphyrinogen-3 oxidase
MQSGLIDSNQEFKRRGFLPWQYSLSAGKTMIYSQQKLVWDTQLIQAYNLSGPRYTSYPTAAQFREDFSESSLLNAIDRSNAKGKDLSLYFHIPFCESLCYYCGCNKIVTPNKQRALPYVHRMIQEMAIYSSLFDSSRQVKQLHWGGGTPNFLSNEEMSLLMKATRRLFSLADDRQGEFSIEIHPGNISPDSIKHLRHLGFNRLSMGVQDFNPSVQKAVNRFNTYEQISSLVKAARNENYRSISMDLIYGLPLQNRQTFQQTLEQIIQLAPDRLSIFNYAHMPHLFKSQQLINSCDLPEASEKLDILHQSIEQLVDAGYVYIGMDHFAKPDDELVKAQQDGKLHRNFQGYSTHSDCDLLAMGMSSISMIDNIYLQNLKDLNSYQRKLDAGLLPFAKGFTLNQEDLLRRYVINQLICHLHVDFKKIERLFDIDPWLHFQYELKDLQKMEQDGLVTITSDGVAITSKGRLLVRRVCMVFDEYLQAGSLIRYSKII